nr:hypothetical protein [Tanacetum cinerariifolium]
MVNLLEDVQCAGSDTRPPMLDRTDFASWKQRTVQETLAEGTEGAPHLGPERPRVYYDLSPKEKDRFVTVVKLKRDFNYDQLYAYLKQHEAYSNENKMMLDRFTQHTVDPLAWMSNVSHQQYYSQSSSTLPSTYVPPYLTDNPYKTFLPQTNNQLRTSSNTRNQLQFKMVGLWFRIFRVDRIEVRGPIHEVEGQLGMGEYRIELGMRIQDLAFNVDNVFQSNDCDVFDSNVDEAPTVQTMFMANLSSADPVYDEAGPSYDSNILSEVHDHDHYQDAVCEHHEAHEMHDNVQLNHVVNSHADYTSDSNMIPYDQYVKDNVVPGVHSNVFFVLNDAYMMIYNDVYEPHAQSVSKTSRNIIVENSLTVKLATYKEQVELYERRVMFELTKREQKINEKLRIVITDRNFKEKTLKKELYSVKLQLASTINHNKLMVEEVTSLENDFKQKENKYLEDFLDMKSLKEKAFPLPGESSHWQYKFPLPVEDVPTARRMEIPLLGVCTAMMKKLPVKENWQLH